MSKWNSGYVSDIDYTYGYYTELNPIRSPLALIDSGFAIKTGIVHCELGFGQGLSINVHAAATNTIWYGTDFNPSQAVFARELAIASGAKIELYDQSFLEFCTRSDLPDFDSISLHGIWSWISNENRAVIIDFVKRKLKVGGLLYISYNTMPGWANFAPVRHLMTQHSEVNGNSGIGIINNVDNALQFISTLIDTSPIFDKANPQARERFSKVALQDRRYLAHEYFNKDWDPMYYADIAKSLEAAKLQFACSAHYLDHVDSINFTSKQLNLLNSISNLNFRETVKDFLINQQFRRDYWIKGAGKINFIEKYANFRKINIVLLINIAEIILKVRGPSGEATLNREIYEPIIDELKSYQVINIMELETRLKNKSISIQSLMQAVIVLSGLGYIAVAQSEYLDSANRMKCEQLNRFLINKSKSSGEICYLASPVTGGGIAVGRFHQLFLLAMAEGLKKPVEWAKFAWRILDEQNQRIVIEGKTIETPDENLNELIRQSIDFEKNRVPILKSLGIV